MDSLSNRVVFLCHGVRRWRCRRVDRERCRELKILTVIRRQPKSHETTKISSGARHLKWTYVRKGTFACFVNHRVTTTTTYCNQLTPPECGGPKIWSSSTGVLPYEYGSTEVRKYCILVRAQYPVHTATYPRTRYTVQIRPRPPAPPPPTAPETGFLLQTCAVSRAERGAERGAECGVEYGVQILGSTSHVIFSLSYRRVVVRSCLKEWLLLAKHVLHIPMNIRKYFRTIDRVDRCSGQQDVRLEVSAPKDGLLMSPYMVVLSIQLTSVRKLTYQWLYWVQLCVSTN